MRCLAESKQLFVDTKAFIAQLQTDNNDLKNIMDKHEVLFKESKIQILKLIEEKLDKSLEVLKQKVTLITAKHTELTKLKTDIVSKVNKIEAAFNSEKLSDKLYNRLVEEKQSLISTELAKPQYINKENKGNKVS